MLRTARCVVVPTVVVLGLFVSVLTSVFLSVVWLKNGISCLPCLLRTSLCMGLALDFIISVFVVTVLASD